MITIHNLRQEKPNFPYDVRVDRSSVLGNIFVMYNEQMRNQVCEQYQKYFDKKIANSDDVFLNELRRLYKIHQRFGKLRLFCWCYPRRCHAETIKAFLDKYIQQI